MMENVKNNIFVVGLNMEKRASEEIAHEAALRIIEITDNLLERKKERRQDL